MRKKLLHRVHVGRTRTHRPKRRWARRIRGFSMIEILLAMGAIGLASVAFVAGLHHEITSVAGRLQ